MLYSPREGKFFEVIDAISALIQRPRTTLASLSERSPETPLSALFLFVHVSAFEHYCQFRPFFFVFASL
jgi:hypothetical protein